jgi:hypothetical protein
MMEVGVVDKLKQRLLEGSMVKGAALLVAACSGADNNTLNNTAHATSDADEITRLNAEVERARAALRLIAETEQWEDAGPSGHAKTPGALRDFAQNVLDGFDPREALATLDRARGVRP